MQNTDQRKTSDGSPALRSSELVSRRRCRKFIVVNLLNATLLCILTVVGGWRVLLGTIGFAVLMLAFVAFIGWLHDD